MTVSGVHVPCCYGVVRVCDRFGLGLIVLVCNRGGAPVPASCDGFAGLRAALDTTEAWELDWINEQTTLVRTRKERPHAACSAGPSGLVAGTGGFMRDGGCS
jgi:hypothetical protein